MQLAGFIGLSLCSPMYLRNIRLHHPVIGMRKLTAPTKETSAEAKSAPGVVRSCEPNAPDPFVGCNNDWAGTKKRWHKTRILKLCMRTLYVVYIYMGVDLNSFIRDPASKPKNTLAKLSPSCVLSFAEAEVCCIYVCHVCCMMDINFVHVNVNGFFFTGKYKINTALFVSMCLLLNC